MEIQEILDEINNLIAAWCDRRDIIALKYILQGFPLAQGLTDEWVALLNALKTVRAWGNEKLPEEEIDTIDDLIIEIDRMMHPY